MLKRFMSALSAAWVILTYKQPPQHHSPKMEDIEGLHKYTLLLDDEADRHMERLRLTYKHDTRATTYGFAVSVLHQVTESLANGWEAPARRDPSSGDVDTVVMPPFDPEVWRRLARPELKLVR